MRPSHLRSRASRCCQACCIVPAPSSERRHHGHLRPSAPVAGLERGLARKVEQHDREIGLLFEQVGRLLEPPPVPQKHPIGYVPLTRSERPRGWLRAARDV
jgi:hypothetical protein